MTSEPSFATTSRSSRPRADVAPAPDASRWLAAGVTLALIGATVGTALDAVHVHTGTTGYTHPALLGQAWWVPPLFASAAIAIGLGHAAVARVVGWTGRPASAARAAQGMAIFILAYVASGVLAGWAWLCAIVLSGLFLVGWLRCDGSALGLVLAALTAVIGTAVEMLLVAAGTFFYVRPSLGGVAAWLPLLYLCASAGVGAFGRWLVER